MDPDPVSSRTGCQLQPVVLWRKLYSCDRLSRIWQVMHTHKLCSGPVGACRVRRWRHQRGARQRVETVACRRLESRRGTAPIIVRSR